MFKVSGKTETGVSQRMPNRFLGEQRFWEVRIFVSAGKASLFKLSRLEKSRESDRCICTLDGRLKSKLPRRLSGPTLRIKVHHGMGDGCYVLREAMVLSGFSLPKDRMTVPKGMLFMERVGPMDGGGGETWLNDETGERGE